MAGSSSVTAVRRSVISVMAVDSGGEGRVVAAVGMGSGSVVTACTCGKVVGTASPAITIMTAAAATEVMAGTRVCVLRTALASSLIVRLAPAKDAPTVHARPHFAGVGAAVAAGIAATRGDTVVGAGVSRDYVAAAAVSTRVVS
jgi:hypothetical protein